LNDFLCVYGYEWCAEGQGDGPKQREKEKYKKSMIVTNKRVQGAKKLNNIIKLDLEPPPLYLSLSSLALLLQLHHHYYIVTLFTFLLSNIYVIHGSTKITYYANRHHHH